MLALYALQLATQDPLLMARTRGDYIQLPNVLDATENAEMGNARHLAAAFGTARWVITLY